MRVEGGGRSRERACAGLLAHPVKKRADIFFLKKNSVSSVTLKYSD
jgi:hypothetical protein